MSSPAEHYRLAEQQLVIADHHIDGSSDQVYALSRAAVHASLAAVSQDTYEQVMHDARPLRDRQDALDRRRFEGPDGMH